MVVIIREMVLITSEIEVSTLLWSLNPQCVDFCRDWKLICTVYQMVRLASHIGFPQSGMLTSSTLLGRQKSAQGRTAAEWESLK